MLGILVVVHRWWITPVVTPCCSILQGRPADFRVLAAAMAAWVSKLRRWSIQTPRDFMLVFEMIVESYSVMSDASTACGLVLVWWMKCMSSVLLTAKRMFRCLARLMWFSRLVCRNFAATRTVFAPWVMISLSM